MSETLFQIDRSRNQLLTEFSKKTLQNRYLIEGEDYQDAFARIAVAYSDNDAHAARMYDYISQFWFMPATPVITNGGTSDFSRNKVKKNSAYPSNIEIHKRGLPISCYLNEVQDSLKGIVDIWNENCWLASKGGGIGTYWGNLRSVGEKIKASGTTSGVIPFIKVMDSMTLAISQGSLRRGSAAVYLQIDHPEIEEFIELRKPTGGDHNRRALNLNHGVVLTDEFMLAVENDLDWHLKSPATGEIIRNISARDLMIRILSTRVDTGEPYVLFIDNVNKSIPEVQKILGLKVKTSNLCSEITLPTGIDHIGNNRTAVCCLGSVNLTYFEKWRDNPIFIEDCVRYLDNILDDFIASAPNEIESAKYGAMRERSIGLGAMGLHDFFQSKMIPFGSAAARGWNNLIFKHVGEQAREASVNLAKEKGACPDGIDAGINVRCSNVTAIAPTASISIIADTSPGIDPIVSNAYTHKTLSGSFIIKNRNLEKLLISKGINSDEVWESIVRSEGSVQHLDYLTKEERDVFKTAFEINQMSLITQAADRQKYIDQAQSLNLFYKSDVDKSELLMVHMLAWKFGIKSLYYLRSMSIQRVENEDSAMNEIRKLAQQNDNQMDLPLKYEECEACQ
jgi:ribonucleoside-diphosphate reductase alpha chain